MNTIPIYEVRTWDCDLRRWTPQEGMRLTYIGFVGLRAAIRDLLARGFDWPSAAIDRVDRAWCEAPYEVTGRNRRDA